MSEDGHGDHGHHLDQGMRGFLRYMKMLPKMWTSPVGRDVVRAVAPQRGERVVDIGAGMGPTTVLAAKAGASVLAVDPTPYMRRILTARRLAQRAPGAIRVVDGSAEHIPADDHDIDAAWTVNTMHHWSDVDAAVAELARVLRPGGRLLLVDEDFDSPAHPEHARMNERSEHRRRHFLDIDPSSVAGKLLAAGFGSAEGSIGSMAGRPAKVVRATR